MKMKTVCGVVCLAWCITAGQPILADELPPLPDEITSPARALSRAFSAVATHVQPSIVSITSQRTIREPREELLPFDNDFFRQFFGQPLPTPRPRTLQGLGSGMIVDKKGRILTNFHVVRDMDEINVQLADKRAFKAELVGSDPMIDVAVIQLKGEVPDDLPVVQLGDSDAVAVGELVMAIGAPFGLARTVTTGIISAKGRANMGIEDYEDFLQTDAAINPGNSGGPLVNMHGEVIGLNTAIATSVGQFSGVGFAIPIKMIKTIMPVLLEGGTVERGFIGVGIQDIDSELARQFELPDTKGALITQVNRGSPAEKAGLEVGDAIVEFQDNPVEDSSQLRNLVASTPPGTKAKLVIVRKGKERELTVTLGKLASDKMAGSAAGEQPLEPFGILVQPLTPDLAKRLDYENQQGVVMGKIIRGSPADQANLQVGDLISAVNRIPISDVDELREALGKTPDSKQVLLLVHRKGGRLFVVLQIPP